MICLPALSGVLTFKCFKAVMITISLQQNVQGEDPLGVVLKPIPLKANSVPVELIVTTVNHL